MSRLPRIGMTTYRQTAAWLHGRHHLRVAPGSRHGGIVGEELFDVFVAACRAWSQA